MERANLVLKQDVVHGMEFQRRQTFENERKQRIFNAEERMLGLNLPTLERQKADKELYRAKLSDLEMRYNNQEKDLQNSVRSQKMLQSRQAASRDADVFYYRCRFQGKRSRREWDLNDPKNFKPTIDFSVLGPSSAQIYSGNDPNIFERQRQQKIQLRSWLEQQREERKKAEAERKAADLEHYKQLTEYEKKLEEKVNMQHINQKAQVTHVHNFNIELARERRIQNEREKMEVREDDMTEIRNTLNSPLMTQSRDEATSKLNVNKKVAHLYRGMTDDEQAKFRADQKRQVKSLCERKIEEGLMHKQWEQYFYNKDRALCLKQLEWDRMEQKNTDDCLLFNKKMIEENRKRWENMYDDKKHEDMQPFYDWFNKTSR